MSIMLAFLTVGCSTDKYSGMSETDMSALICRDVADAVDAVEYIDNLQKQGWKLEKDIAFNKSMSLLPGWVELSCGDIMLGVCLDIDHVASLDGAEADGVTHIDSYRSKYWVIKGIKSIKLASSRSVTLEPNGKKVPENFIVQRAIEDAITKGDTLTELEMVIIPMGFVRMDENRVCKYVMGNYTLIVNHMQQSVMEETAIESIVIEYNEITNFNSGVLG